MFEGFDCGEFMSLGEHYRPNVLKILQDTESNVHYNLHGSAYWEVLDLDENELPNSEIVLSDNIHLQSNNSPASIQIERGKTLLITNIITGYQKAQKSMLTPFKQMQSAFDADCCLADTIMIIGYSFGDEHINYTLKSALRYNPSVKIVIVDPHFITNKMDYEFVLRFFPYKSSMGNMRPKKVSDGIYSYFGGEFLVYTLGFKEFLQAETKAARL